MKIFFVLSSDLPDFENHHNRIEEDFDRVFDHNISIELVCKYALEEEKQEYAKEEMENNTNRVQPRGLPLEKRMKETELFCLERKESKIYLEF